MDAGKTQELLDRYLSTGRLPRDHDLTTILKSQPSILQRQSIIEKVRRKIGNFIQTFVDGM